MKPWELEDDRLMTPCKVWDLRARIFRQPAANKRGEFYYLQSRDWGLVVALTAQDEVVLVRQFRWGINDFAWEVPGGIIDEGEDTVAAALRELREETGYAAAGGRIIGGCHPNPAILDNRFHVVLAENVELVSATDWDEHEEMEVHLVPFDEALEMARSGRINHALAVAALFYCQMERLRGPGA